MFSYSTLTVLCLSASGALASIAVFPRAPPGCIADNCLRAVTGTQPGQTQTKTDRVADCSSFLLKTVTPDTVTITQTATLTASATLSFATTTTATVQQLDVAPNKRSAVTVSASNVPAYASPCSGVVRYASACSCAGIAASTVTVSAPTTTITISATITATIDVTSTSTSIVAASSTAPPTGHPTCSPQSATVQGAGVDYVLEFSGSGVSEDPNNPSNQATPDITTFPGTLDDCQAADACATFVWNTPNNDYSFDLHYLIDENVWYCAGYYNALSSGDDFSVVDPNVGAAYLFEY